MLSLITSPHILKVQFDVRLLLQFDNRLSICKHVLSLVSTGDGAGCVCEEGTGRREHGEGGEIALVFFFMDVCHFVLLLLFS